MYNKDYEIKLRQICKEDLKDFPAHVESIEHVLNCPFFKLGWGFSSKTPHHHAYSGGLLDHTFEVFTIASSLAHLGKLSDLDYTNLVVAVLWHDYGKIYTYYEETGEKTADYKRLGHIVTSVKHFEVAHSKSKNTLEYSDYMEIIHAILAHHGKHEWRSPVEPQTKIARILHAADYASAFAKLY